MNLSAIHQQIADNIRDTGGVIDDNARDRVLSAVLVKFNHSTAINASIADPTSVDDFYWQQIINLASADLLDQMANHSIGGLTASAMGNAISDQTNKSEEYRRSANKLRRQAYNMLGWSMPSNTSTPRPASTHIQL